MPDSKPDSKSGELQKALLAVGDGVLGAAVLIVIGTWGG